MARLGPVGKMRRVFEWSLIARATIKDDRLLQLLGYRGGRMRRTNPASPLGREPAKRARRPRASLTKPR